MGFIINGEGDESWKYSKELGKADFKGDSRKEMSLKLKMMIYKTVTMPVMFYRWEPCDAMERRGSCENSEDENIEMNSGTVTSTI